VSDSTRTCAVVRFAKRGPARLVGHLDLARAFDRAVRRAGVPVTYTQGFNRHARIAFGPSLALGMEGLAELCVMELDEPADAEALKLRLGEQMPPGLEIVDVQVQGRGRRSPLADLSRAGYRVELALQGVDVEDLRRAIRDVLEAGSLEIVRRTKSGEKAVDIRPGILGIELLPGDPLVLNMELAVGDGAITKPQELCEALNRALGRTDAVAFRRPTRTTLC
jgi:radical SAM-linked protein